MSNNQTLLQKADLALADLSANAGLLNPERGDRFIRRMIAQPTVLNMVRVVGMNAPQRKIDRIIFGSRILHAAPASNGGDVSGLRSKPTLSQIELNTKEMIAIVYIPYDVMEDNLERSLSATNDGSNNSSRGGLHDTIVDMIAERAAADLEDICLNSVTTHADPDLKLFNGWLALANKNVVNAAGAPISTDIIKAGIKAMPKQYRRDLSKMYNIITPNDLVDLRDIYGKRLTGLGDVSLQNAGQVLYQGTPAMPCNYMPDHTGLLCDPRNLILGIQRQMSMEFDKDIEQRVYKIVLTLRADVQIEEDLAVVKYTNVNPA